jgi:hypothetical protein
MLIIRTSTLLINGCTKGVKDSRIQESGKGPHAVLEQRMETLDASGAAKQRRQIILDPLNP